MYVQLNTEQLEQLQSGETIEVTVPINYRNRKVTVAPPEA